MVRQSDSRNFAKFSDTCGVDFFEVVVVFPNGNSQCSLLIHKNDIAALRIHHHGVQNYDSTFEVESRIWGCSACVQAATYGLNVKSGHEFVSVGWRSDVWSYA